MERFARARFQVIRVNRWSLALVLLLLLAILLYPIGKNLPAGSSPDETIKEGVTLMNRDFSGKSEAEARTMLNEMALNMHQPAVAAKETKDANGISYVTPELDGYHLDVDTTWFRLSTAKAGSRVNPATAAELPAKSLAEFPMSVIRQGNAGKKEVALLINVDWGELELAKMLPVFKKLGAKATFFVSGKWANNNKDLLKKIAADGHEIATHGYDLASGPKAMYKANKLKSDIAHSVEVIQQITGMPVRYYAPHQSEVDADILRTAGELKLRTVLYSLDTVDWSDSTSGDKILTTLNKAMPGDLVLMHPKPNTARVLEQALLRFQQKGLHPVTLSELLSPEPELPSATDEAND
ncbi:MAG: polysaccharide deacetylase family protein [Mycobacterium leprae]